MKYKRIIHFIKQYVDDLSLEELNLVADIIGNMIDRGNYYINWYEEKDARIKLQEQQKEFIKYLEANISACENVSDLLFNHNKELKIYKEVLQKYKEITGDDK